MWRHILAIAVLPGTVTVLVPTRILWGDFGRVWDVRPLAFVGGCVALALGLAMFCYTLGQFARVGKGTLAPWDPPKHLVVRGVYRHVRNPMITGVLLVLLGESGIFHSTALLEWTAAFFAINAIYIPLYEERRLRERFGEEYALYARNVPRWIPRLRGWVPPWDEAPERGAPSP